MTSERPLKVLGRFLWPVGQATLVIALVVGLIFMCWKVDREADAAPALFMKWSAAKQAAYRASWQKDCLTENKRYRCDVLWAQARSACQ